MADIAAGRSSTNGIAFLISFEVVVAIIAFACSSPQTAEINIQSRGGTLMKWVHIGEALSVAVIAIAAMIDRGHRAPILAGGAIAIGSSEALYQYAKASGLRNPGPGTEGQKPAGRWGG